MSMINLRSKKKNRTSLRRTRNLYLVSLCMLHWICECEHADPLVKQTNRSNCIRVARKCLDEVNYCLVDKQAHVYNTDEKISHKKSHSFRRYLEGYQHPEDIALAWHPATGRGNSVLYSGLEINRRCRLS